MRHKRRRILLHSLAFLLAFCILWTGSKATEVQAAKAGWVTKEDRIYYLKSNGKYATGWLRQGDNYFYLSRTAKGQGHGLLLTGWRTINDDIYFLRTTGEAGVRGRRATGWRQFGSKIYHFDRQGALHTGLQTISGKKFYFQPGGEMGKKGTMLKGWRTVKGEKRYFRKGGELGVKGSMAVNTTLTIDGEKYYFDENGDTYNYTPPTSQEDFVNTIGELARKDMKASGILASITTAQAILESGYGTSTLATRANNLFGMKAMLSGNTWASEWGGKVYKVKTQEYYDGKYVTIVAEFRAYDDHLESINDHSNYLRGAKNGSSLRYEGLVGCTNYRKAAKIIKNGGYATDPKYVDKLCSIIEDWDLTRFDR